MKTGIRLNDGTEVENAEIYKNNDHIMISMLSNEALSNIAAVYENVDKTEKIEKIQNDEAVAIYSGYTELIWVEKVVDTKWKRIKLRKV